MHPILKLVISKQLAVLVEKNLDSGVVPEYSRITHLKSLLSQQLFFLISDYCTEKFLAIQIKLNFNSISQIK